jgi:hypothetical protein
VDTKRLTEIWDGCDLIDSCALPYAVCYICQRSTANQKPKKEVQNDRYEQYRPAVQCVRE